MKKTTSLALSLLLAHSANAAIGTVTLDEIDSKPPSRAKNFLIWQFLNQDITPEQAKEAFYQIDSVNHRFLKAYAAKTDESEFKYVTSCIDKKASEITSIKNDDCLFLALSPIKADALSSTQRNMIYSHLGDRFGDLSYLKTLNRDDHFLANSDFNSSLKLFLSSNQAMKQKYFNKPLTLGAINELSELKGFDSFVVQVATNPTLKHLQRSISIAPIKKRGSQANFFLALMSLKYGDSDRAIENLKFAKSGAYFASDKDKATFWLYQITEDKALLQELADSLDINIYSLYAAEKLGVKKNNFYYQLSKKSHKNWDKNDPFTWYNISQEIKNSSDENLYRLIDKYDSLAIEAYIIESKYGSYAKNYTMAYDEYMSELNTDQKAMLYSLMRQESQMIPGVISTSFALGLMQIMPFNVDAINKYHKLKVSSYSDMFEPKYNIAYAIEHMKHIDKALKSPLFKAYAYNGGIGFTKRHLISGDHFNSGKYEPFISMELMSNVESREYGKKVLANYTIYKRVLGEEVSIIELLNNLTKPELSDNFRK